MPLRAELNVNNQMFNYTVTISQPNHLRQITVHQFQSSSYILRRRMQHKFYLLFEKVVSTSLISERFRRGFENGTIIRRVIQPLYRLIERNLSATFDCTSHMLFCDMQSNVADTFIFFVKIKVAASVCLPHQNKNCVKRLSLFRS